ncbi:IS1182 family transposase [Clostridium saccharobutylicum]|uniref:IS1182 family transposase n=2 Tax=Clostridium saccharobutylicum TaxID=169679 RepID=UPI000983DC88|nr:IS1182 family transposase [Clostridium saccharobutylicum]AQR91364.1 transposase DDE domain protein [Clostridium saccharobutylicum]AQS01268.1 transposase DDE domain protein [Clostridium saccharobutylicum]AQS15251.1 transposase DDE domain protein [Clostridium saccharobutylicum]MBA2905874.1 transposase [Clostridium saccharobutylicum]MBA8790387.1 transposase [Clostridium saccharobutylicum]
MIKQQQTMILSPYSGIYDIVVPNDNLLRKINELIDFSFIYDELLDKYCLDNGRNAIAPTRMFKYLLLKTIFDLSDIDIVERSKYDMSFKYFLDMAPEDDVIDASSLTKFRKLRLKDLNLLDMLINKTVTVALEKGIIKSKSVIVDATHTKARYNQKSPREILQERSKKLRKSVYEIDETMKDIFPVKNTVDKLEEEIVYCQKLIKAVESNELLASFPKVKEKLNLLSETLDDDIERLNISSDADAKIGHKTADSSFFGYKTHIAMSEERIITAAAITTGEKSDGKELKALINKTMDSGFKIDTIIGDAAYSEKGNIEFANENGIQLVSKLNTAVTQGHRRKEDEFEFNKDAGMYVCKAGHMAFRKVNQIRKNKNLNKAVSYYFDIDKCKYCSYKEGCYKEGSKSKTYTVTIKSDVHKAQMDFEKSEYFKEKSKERYKIEAKNSELKHRHGYDVASSSGLVGMQLQGAVAIFAVNLKRIIKLIGGK